MFIPALTAGLLVATCVMSAQNINAPARTERQPMSTSTGEASPLLRARLMEERAKNPYEQLFPTTGTTPRSAPARRPTATQICGLTVWNVDADLDPRMIIRQPEPKREFSIRKIQPTVCAE
jgi:hypothetical protein